MPTTAQFCAKCGRSVGDIPGDDGRDVQTFNRTPTSMGFYLLLVLSVVGFCLFAWYSYPTMSMDQVAEAQIKALRTRKVTDAYYKYTAKEFQNVTSLQAFREFVESYPVLQNNRSFKLEDEKIDEEMGLLKGILVSKDNQSMHVEFQFVKESSGWKVLSMRIKELIVSSDPNSYTVIQQMMGVIQAQLQALQASDIATAYYRYASQDFQEHTSLEMYRAFLNSYAIFKDHDRIEFKNRSVENQIGKLTVLLHKENAIIPVEYQLKREDGEWKVWSMRLIPQEKEEAKTEEDPNLLVEPVREQLSSLLKDEIEYAYYSTSSQFQKNTSYDQFHQFVTAFPILSSHISAEFVANRIEEHVGKTEVALYTPNRKTLMEYTLAAEDGKWRVMGMDVLEETEILTDEQDVDSEELIRVVESHLLALRSLDFSAAYQAYTAKSFQDKVSYSDFLEFIRENPEFVRAHSFDFDQLKFEEGVGLLSGTLRSSDELVQVEYQMVHEGNSWKILHVDLEVEAVDLD